MPNARVAAVRRFNRFYTKQIGILAEGHLRSPFTLTEVRVLFEICHGDGVAAVDLAGGLRLDPGYLSRILRRFREENLVRTETSAADGRRTMLWLTWKGRNTFATLDRRQDCDVAALLARAPVHGQRLVVESMRTIEHVLREPSEDAGEAYQLRHHRPGDMGWVVHRHGVLYSQEQGYDARYEGLVASIVAGFLARRDAARERCWIAERHGEIIGSVFLVKRSTSVAQLRLLLVEPSARAHGLGARLIDECVRFARRARYRTLTLWTQSELLPARHLYRKAGFKLVGTERHRRFTRRELVAETWALAL